MQHTEPDRVRSAVRHAVELGRHDRPLTELDGAGVGAGQHRALGRALEDLAAIERRPARVIAGREQLERAFVVGAGFGEGIHGFGRLTSKEQGRDRAVPVTGRVPMVGQLGRCDRHPADLAASFQLAAERRVEPIAFALEQLAVGDLGEQGMVERIPAAHRSGGHQHAVDDGRPQGIGDDWDGQTQYLGKELLVDPPTGDRGAAKDLSRPVGQGPEALDEHVAQTGRQPPIRPLADAGGRELLDEERVATRPCQDIVRALRGRDPIPAETPQQARHLGPAEWAELDPLDPALALQLRQHPHSRKDWIQIVGPHRQQQQDGLVSEVSR